MSVKLSVVIPCYQSASMIDDVVRRVRATVQQRYHDQEYEIILVNDASPDNTFDVLRHLAEASPNVKVLNFSKNFGQHAALMAGFSVSEGAVVLCMDDDGQTPPEELFKLVDRLNDSCDLVYARYETKQHSWFRNVGSKLNDKMACSLIGKPKDLYLWSYFAAKRYLVDEVLHYTNPYPYMQGLMLRATSRVANVPISHRERKQGQSGYTLKKLFSLWLNGFTAFSVKPLRVASLLGLAFALLGFLSAIVVVIRRLLDPSMALGWSSTFTLILVMGGLILFVLGLIGEYVGRSYICLSTPPQYVIRDSLNCEASFSGSAATKRGA